MQKLTIKESEWGTFSLLNRDKIYLLASGLPPQSSITRCCLGFWCGELKIPEDIFERFSTPRALWFSDKMDEFLQLQPHFNELMKVNDSPITSDFTYEDKKLHIQQMFREAGIEVEFIA